MLVLVIEYDDGCARTVRVLVLDPRTRCARSLSLPLDEDSFSSSYFSTESKIMFWNDDDDHHHHLILVNDSDRALGIFLINPLGMIACWLVAR